MKNRALHAAIVLVIAMAAGPEFFAAQELILLLELLGATLFLSAYGAGLQLALMQLLQIALRLLVPEPQRTVLRSRVSAREKALAFAYVTVNGMIWIASAFVVGAYVGAIPTLLA